MVNLLGMLHHGLDLLVLLLLLLLLLWMVTRKRRRIEMFFEDTVFREEKGNSSSVMRSDLLTTFALVASVAGLELFAEAAVAAAPSSMDSIVRKSWV